ncbi:MATE family efflux transporter [Halanaerobium salsuginis]|uniref:MatE protein n=1 Tax=Halanaerobium salsuginis TaxID=29563 RepID=A0A1I4JIT7_9FIRM|nr:MATE family efflux transporter [Halanaerobium salsuginis]SFL66036.1 MatE protein [Halanaerobium salsuginis]
MKRNLTKGSVLKTVIYFSMPYLLAYFLQTLYGMADLLIIGQFNGVESTTAVSIGSQVMRMLTVMIVGLAMGSTIIIGRAIGGKKEKDASHAIGNTITLFMAISIILSVTLIFVVKPIVTIMSTPFAAVFCKLKFPVFAKLFSQPPNREKLK